MSQSEFHPMSQYLQIAALREPHLAGITFWMYIREPGRDDVWFPEPIVYTLQEDYDRAAAVNRPAFSLSYDNAQKLMDDLYASGIRPTHEQDVAGALKATENHLADMKRLVFDKVRQEERSNVKH